MNNRMSVKTAITVCVLTVLGLGMLAQAADPIKTAPTNPTAADVVSKVAKVPQKIVETPKVEVPKIAVPTDSLPTTGTAKSAIEEEFGDDLPVAEEDYSDE